MKNIVRLENYCTPWELERAIARFADHHNYERLHEAIGNITPDDLYHDPQHASVSRREKAKRLTLERGKEENLHNAASLQAGAGTSLQEEPFNNLKRPDDSH